MTSEEFNKLTLEAKWIHVESVMKYIQQMDSLYSMRRRLNPHHSKEDIKLEDRNVRIEQYQRWSHVKDLYATHRDELANTLDNERFQECKSIMERIFTLELDEALKDIINES